MDSLASGDASLTIKKGESVLLGLSLRLKGPLAGVVVSRGGEVELKEELGSISLESIEAEAGGLGLRNREFDALGDKDAKPVGLTSEEGNPEGDRLA